ncbi:MAG: glycosyltransferase 87 family protein [Anaerolineales bacterium]
MEPVIHKKYGWLIAVAVATPGLYICLAVHYPISSSLVDPRASWASLVTPNGLNLTLHLAVYLGLTLLYLAAMHLLTPAAANRGAPPRYQIALILTVWLACSGVLMFVAPAGESHDIFDYLFRGRMMTEYQANPLAEVPESFGLSIPYVRYLAWRKNVDTYGPIWEASSAGVASIVRQVSSWIGWWDESYPVCPKSPESCRLLVVYIAGYRMLAIILAGLSGWIIASMVRRNQPSLAPLALAVWLLNPMTLVATALGGHNDAVMLVLILSSCWLLQRQHPYLAMLALILAAHVKLTALIWLPACALWILWRWGWGRALKVGLASAVSGLVLSWLLYAPFGGWQSLPRMLQERSQYLANSLWRIVRYLLINQWDWPVESAHRLTVELPTWLFAAGALLISLWIFNLRPKRWRGTPIPLEKGDQMLWRALVAISMLYLVIGSFWFQTWYVLWVIAPAALLPGSWFTRSIIPWLVFGALSANLAMDFLSATLLKTAPPIFGYILVVVIIWSPAVIAMGFQFLPGYRRLINPRLSRARD